MNTSTVLHNLVSSQIIYPTLRQFRSLDMRYRSDKRHYSDGMKFREKAWEWPQLMREEWILERLRETLQFAYETTEYYRRVFDEGGIRPSNIRSFDDFATIPILERETVQKYNTQLFSASVSEHVREWNATGGSSGQPVEIQMGPRERGWRASGADFSMMKIGVPLGHRRALLWGHHLDPVQRTTTKDKLLDFLGNRQWFECLRLSPETLKKYDLEMRRYQPECIIAYASAMASFAQEIQASQFGEPTYPRRCIVTGAEKLLKEQRELIQQVFSVPIHERYGSRDVGDMGFQYTPEDDPSFTIDWALVLLEPASEETESDILITKLQADAMPMIRYRTDDVGIFPQGARPGHPQMQIREVLGRRADRVFRPGGGWVHGIHFPHLFKEMNVRDFQVNQKRDYSLEVKVVLKEVNEKGRLGAIMENLQKNLPEINITISEVSEIPRTKASKWRPVITEVNS